MKILIDIPDSDVPKKQELISVDLHFIDGKVCECTYPFEELIAPRVGRWKGFTHSAYHGVDEDNEPIWYPVNIYHCSQCNRRTVIKENYCPNCGCKMCGGEEE